VDVPELGPWIDLTNDRGEADSRNYGDRLRDPIIASCRPQIGFCSQSNRFIFILFSIAQNNASITLCISNRVSTILDEVLVWIIFSNPS
jgi:hypothetical protein